MSQRQTQCSAENYLVIWIDGNIDMANEDCQHTLTQLRGVVNQVNICSMVEECIQWLNENKEETAFVISSGALGQHLVPKIHGMPQLDTIYIFCSNKQRHQAWAKDWAKIKGVHTSIKSICQALEMAVKQCNQNKTTVSIIGANEECSSNNFNNLEPSFMYSQIFKEILLDMEHGQRTIKDLVNFCQKQYEGNIKEIELIDEFQHTYHPTLAIWWYTRECFTYKMLNRALRTLDGDIIIRMAFFLCDIHQQIEDLHKKQASQYCEKSFLVFRGQGLLTADFEKLEKNKGGLVAFNNFLSTSKNRHVSLGFAEDALETTDMVGILFQMTIDPTNSSTPFASIQEESFFKNEDEILFSMHTIFRIGDIRKLHNNRPLYEVNLKLTSDDDQQLHQLTDCIREEVDGTGWYRMGQLLLKIGQFDKAEELYTALLAQTSADSDTAYIYNQLGCVKCGQGQYEKEIAFYEKALEIDQRTLPKDHPSLAPTYSNIGLVYKKMGNYSKALEFYEEAQKIYEKALPPNHPDLASCYGKNGVVYNAMRDYSKALEFYKKSHKIYEKALPPNHPDLATSYSNIGQVHNNMGDYSKALEFYEKALKIREKALPPNHPDLATSYGNIGQVYKNMRDYSKALELYEKDLAITKKALPPNHPDLATSYNNIGQVYKDMGDYSKALEFYEKDLEITKIALPPNHPDLATSYNNIGMAHYGMNNYSKALPFLENALSIRRKSLPSTHSLIQTTIDNIDHVKKKM